MAGCRAAFGEGLAVNGGWADDERVFGGSAVVVVVAIGKVVCGRAVTGEADGWKVFGRATLVRLAVVNGEAVAVDGRAVVGCVVTCLFAERLENRSLELDSVMPDRFEATDDRRFCR